LGSKFRQASACRADRPLYRFEHFGIGAKVVFATYLASQPSFTHILRRAAVAPLTNFFHDDCRLTAGGDSRIESNAFEHTRHAALGLSVHVLPNCEEKYEGNGHHDYGGTDLKH
jgi:hypothetical protein